MRTIIGSTPVMQEVYGLIEKAVQSNTTVIIRGESGTGKNLVANAIHYRSLRADRPFVELNLATGIFGYTSTSDESGDWQIAWPEWMHGGTVLLDEIGDFPMNIQMKVFHVIEAKEFKSITKHHVNKSNVRIIVATNKNLEEAIKAGGFREDLYYRINVFPIFLPPLRERKDDIMLLADTFLEKFAKENSKHITHISKPAIEMLTSYHWPGNVRELENCVERAVLVCNEDVIRSEHLPPSLQMNRKIAVDTGSKMTLTEIIENKEKEVIVDTLKKVGGSQRKTATELGITERILGYKIKKYGITPKYL